MPQEGQAATGPNGERAVYRNGRWVYDSTAGPSVTPIPESPSRTADRQRDDAAASRDNIRTGLNVEQNSRQAAAQPFDFAKDLRQEYNKLPEIAQYQTVIRQFATALKTEPTPSGDQALITAYAKMLDPNSVVREQEFATVANADSRIGQIEASIAKQLGLENGGMFRPEIRDRVRHEMQNLAIKYNQSYNLQRSRYANMARANGVDPEMVIGPHVGKPFLKELGEYGGRLSQDQTGPTAPGGFASAFDDKGSVPIPPQMQQKYEAYVNANRGRLDPQEYAKFRIGLASEFGFGGNEGQAAEFASEAERMNKDAAEGRPLNLQIPAVDIGMQAQDRVNSAVFNNPVGGFAEGMADFHGGLDEAAAAYSSATRGTPYDVELARANATKQTLADEHPVANALGKVAGSVATGVGGAAMAPRLAEAMATTRGAMAGGAGFGAVEGALENNDNRALGAGVGAGAGVAGGLVGQKIVAPAAERLARALSRAPKLSGAEQTVASSLTDQDAIDAASLNIGDAERLGLPFNLADSDPKLRALAGSATRMSPEALARAEPGLESRSLGQVERAIGAIDQHLAPTTDLTARAKMLRQAGSVEAGPFYEQAFSRAAPLDDRVSAILATPTGKDALNRARSIASDRGMDPNKLGFDLDAQGNTTLAQTPSFETLDLAKKGIDARLQQNANPMTGKIDFTGRPDLQAIEGLRSRYVKLLDELNPPYKQARDTYAPFVQRAEALGQGQAAKARSVSPTDLQGLSDNFSPEALGEFRTGYATGMKDDALNTSLGRNPFKTIYGSAAQQEKIGSLFPGAEDFGRHASLEDGMAKTTQEVLGGSQTARRMAADDSMGADLLAGLVENGASLATSGGPSVGFFTRMAAKGKFGLGERGQQRAGDVADLLLAPRKQEDLDAMMAARTVQIARENMLRRRLGLAGAVTLPALSTPLVQ